MSHLYDQSPLGKGFSMDMFGRLKIAQPFTIFDSMNRYKLSGDFSNVIVDGSVTYNANLSAALLNVTSNSGSKVYYETKRIMPYQPGKALQILQTFNFADAKANLRQRAGYFSNTNGFFLEQDSSSVYLVKRSFSTGALVETKIPQSQWNKDLLNGTGPSGYTLDLSKAQILFTEIEWLGVGSVRMGFVIDGQFVIAHQFDHSNRTKNTYITTASLPIRYEIENTGTTNFSSNLAQICATVISNGGYERKTESWTATRTYGIVPTVAPSWAPVVSIRMAPGRTDSVILPLDLSITGDGNNTVYEWALLRNANVQGGAWETHVDSSGNTQFKSNATSIVSGTGVQIQSGIFSSTAQSAGAFSELGDFRFDLQLGRDQNEVSDTVTLAIRYLTGTAGTAYGSIGWNDLL